MKIKKFEELNEGISVFSDRNVFPVKEMGLLNDMDIKKIKRKGKKVFYLSSELKFEEANSINQLKYKAKLNKEFPYLLFTTDDKIEKITPLAHNIFEMKKLQEKKTKLLFEYIVAYIQKDDEADTDENITENFEDNIKNTGNNIQLIKNLLEDIWTEGYIAGTDEGEVINPTTFTEYWDDNGDKILMKLKDII